MAELFGGEDMGDAIDLLATGSYVVTRSAAATVDGNGRKTAGATTTFEAVGVMWPAPGRELERLPEGLRDREARMFVTTSKLRTLEAGEADLVDDGEGGTFEVQKNADWKAGRFGAYLVVRRP